MNWNNIFVILGIQRNAIGNWIVLPSRLNVSRIRRPLTQVGYSGVPSCYVGTGNDKGSVWPSRSETSDSCCFRTTFSFNWHWHSCDKECDNLRIRVLHGAYVEPLRSDIRYRFIFQFRRLTAKYWYWSTSHVFKTHHESSLLDAAGCFGTADLDKRLGSLQLSAQAAPWSHRTWLQNPPHIRWRAFHPLPTRNQNMSLSKWNRALKASEHLSPGQRKHPRKSWRAKPRTQKQKILHSPLRHSYRYFGKIIPLLWLSVIVSQYRYSTRFEIMLDIFGVICAVTAGASQVSFSICELHLLNFHPSLWWL